MIPDVLLPLSHSLEELRDAAGGCHAVEGHHLAHG